jgi:hypothetical protein
MADGKVAIKKHTIYKRILHATKLCLVDRRQRLVGEEVVLAWWQQLCHKREKEKEKEKEYKKMTINWIPARTVHATKRLHRRGRSLCSEPLRSEHGVPAQRPLTATRLPFNWPGSAMRLPIGVPAPPPRRPSQ